MTQPTADDYQDYLWNTIRDYYQSSCDYYQSTDDFDSLPEIFEVYFGAMHGANKEEIERLRARGRQALMDSFQEALEDSQEIS